MRPLHETLNSSLQRAYKIIWSDFEKFSFKVRPKTQKIRNIPGIPIFQAQLSCHASRSRRKLTPRLIL